MIEAFTDGARKATGMGGWGFVIHHQGEVYFRGNFLEGVTNNMAEITAFIECITVVNVLKGEEPATICSDSTYLVNGYNIWMEKWRMRGWTKTSGPKNTEVANKDLWIHLYCLKSNNVAAIWTRGHAGHKENELCDKIANFCHDNKCLIGGVINVNEMDSLKLSEYIIVN